MRRIACALGLAVLTCVACTKFGSSTSEPPTDGAPPVDAGRAKDASAAPDASTADGGPFDTPPQLFDDFERPDLPGGGPLSLQLLTADETSVDENTCDDGSPPACSGETIRFQAEVFVSRDPGSGDFLSGPLAPTSRQVRFDFGMKVLGPNNDRDPSQISQAQLASFELTNDHYVYFEIRDGNFYLGDQFKKSNGTDYANEEVIVSTAVEGWHFFQILVDLDALSGTVAIDGVVEHTKAIRQEIATQKFSAVRVGTTYTDGASDFQQLVDNLGLSQSP